MSPARMSYLLKIKKTYGNFSVKAKHICGYACGSGGEDLIIGYIVRYQTSKQYLTHIKINVIT